MEHQDSLESGNGLPFIGLSDNNCDVGDINTSLPEKFLLDEADSYFDDIISCLTVSRMVSDSVIKGIVNAIEMEAAERVASKEAEILALNKRLQLYGSVVTKEDQLEASTKMVEPKKAKLSFNQHSLGERPEVSYIAHISESELKAQDYLKKLKGGIKDIRDTHLLSEGKDKDFCRVIDQKLIVIDGFADALQKVLALMHQQLGDTCLSLKNLISEQEWQQNFQIEINLIVLQNLIMEHQHDFEAKVTKQQILADTFTKNWQNTVDHLSTMRQELDDISSSLLSSEPGQALSDLAKMASQLKQLSKDEQITYDKTQTAEMKRQHESVLLKTIDEVFSLGRDYHKVKKDNKLLRKKIVGFISTLDNILLENEKSSIVQAHENMLHILYQRIDLLLFENKQLKIFLTDKAKEVGSAVSKIPNGLNQSTHRPHDDDSFVHRKEFKMYLEDLESESIIRDKIHETILRELIGELTLEMEYLDLGYKIEHDLCITLCAEYIKDAISSIDPFIEKHCKERDSLAAVVAEREKALSLEMEGNKQLKQEKEMLLKFIEEKSKLLSETEVKLTAQKDLHDKVCHEINMLKEQLSDQSLYISETKKESDLVNKQLVKKSQQVKQYESELREINKNYRVACDTLKDLEKQKIFLHDLVAEKQMRLASAVAKEEEHSKFMTVVANSVSKLSENIMQLEYRVRNKLETNESRLEFLGDQCNDLSQQVNSLIKKTCWYKQGFERKSSDLQKAETEVDLLGDEVDVLVRLLEKIYMALEHYSPVLQHYPGVVETLKLIRREMKSNTT